MKRVVVVEDDADTRMLITMALEAADYDVTAYASAVEAMNPAFYEGVSAVVIDLMMPGISGLGMLEWARHWTKARLVACTALVKDDVNAKNLADAYVHKPFDLPILLSSLEGDRDE